MLLYLESLQSKLGNDFILMLFSNSVSIELKFFLHYCFPLDFSDRPVFEPSPTHLGCK